MTAQSGERLNKYGLYGRVARKTPFSPRGIRLYDLASFANLHINNPQKFSNNILWTDENKVVISGHHALPCLANTNHNISHTGDDLWFFAAIVLVNLTVIETTMIFLRKYPCSAVH